ncbi:MAG: radical SAM protein [bacterium]|nr:radical SAM protein [bacterium]
MEKKREYCGKKVTFMSCSVCNTKCKHCYVSYKGNIDSKDLYDMCLKLKSKYQLNINGTEILLQNYYDSLKLINQYRILTNGIAITNNPKILTKLQDAGVNMIAMSYHFGIHDKVSDVKQCLIENNIKLIQKKGMNVELMCTITQKNYNLVLDICEKALKLNVHKLRFINYLKTGNALTITDNNVLTDEQKKEFFRQLTIARNIYAKEDLLIKRCGTFGKDFSNSKCNFICPAGQDEIVIAPNLKVYPCIFLVKEGYEIGEYINGHIYLNKIIIHDGNLCLADQIFNKNKQIKFERLG